MATSSSSSSAKKVAKLAQRGRGKKVRFQGGTLFPAVVLGVVIVSLLTIVYARESRPDPGSFPPQVGDHWHAAYGMYVCDGWLPKLTGNQEETVTDSQGVETAVNQDYSSTGVHSHDDGVIHYHPFSAKSVNPLALRDCSTWNRPFEKLPFCVAPFLLRADCRVTTPLLVSSSDPTGI